MTRSRPTSWLLFGVALSVGACAAASPQSVVQGERPATTAATNNTADGVVLASGASSPQTLPPTKRFDAELEIKAHAARLCLWENNRPCAERTYAAIVAAWSEAVKEQNDPGGLPSTAKSDLALSEVTEAFFFLANEKDHRAGQLKMPSYLGDRSEESVRDQMANLVLPWMREKEELVDEAAAAFNAAGSFEGAPKEALVNALAMAGFAHAEAAEAFLAPVFVKGNVIEYGSTARTREVASFPARRADYQTLDAASAREKAFATLALRKCQAEAATYHIDNEWVARCKAWLEENK